MKRREFIRLFGTIAVAWPLSARAQQATPQPTIGFLGTDQSIWSPWTAAFVERLRELGWIEGHTVSIKYRWTEGRLEHVADIAVEFVRLKVDVIVSYGTAVPEIKRIISTIPIVFPIAMDPVSAGLVASLAQPGGNVTGLSIEQSDVAGKRLELLREVVPRFSHVLWTELHGSVPSRCRILDKILRGTMPGDIPVEQPTKFDLVINLTTAKTIGLTIPPGVLAMADEVIE
jgi:putative ABC transport system substrate-binding protein